MHDGHWGSMRSLRNVQVGLLLLSVASTPIGVAGEDVPAAPSREPEMPERVDNAIKKGCSWLAKTQAKDGSFPGQYPVATTSLAGLAWLASGSTPHDGPHAANVMRALHFILKSQGKSGFITENAASDGSMHGHGFATQFLAEAYGMIRDPEFGEKVRDSLTKAVHLLENTQNQFGGWNSAPNASATDDGSGAVAIMQVQALRAAQSCGIPVKEQVITKAKKYLLEMTNNDGWYAYNYNMRREGQGSASTTAAGMYMLGALNLHENVKYSKGMLNLMHSAPYMKGGGNWGYPLYTDYYAALAMYQRGGKEWTEWYPKMSDYLLKSQQGDGQWQDGFGGVMTAMAILSLEIPYRYLPMFQEGGAAREGR